jgi:hypothetical protein
MFNVDHEANAKLHLGSLGLDIGLSSFHTSSIGLVTVTRYGTAAVHCLITMGGAKICKEIRVKVVQNPTCEKRLSVSDWMKFIAALFGLTGR